MIEKTISKLREELAETLERVYHTKTRVGVKRRNKIMCVVMPLEDARFLERLEEAYDIEKVRQVLANPDPIPFEDALKECGLTADDL